MLKKLFSFLAITMMAMTAWADGLTVVEVTTWQGIKEYLASSDRDTKKCKLMADIDFNGGQIEELQTDYNNFKAFYIDGNNHTIKNGTLKNYYLIIQAANCTIENLTFEGITTTRTILVENAFGGCNFNNLTFKNCTITTGTLVSGVCDGFVCQSAKAVTGYTAPINFTNITVTNCSVTGDDKIGTIVGHIGSPDLLTTCNLTNCNVSGTNITGNAYVGGLVGCSVGNGTIQNCSFGGKIFADGDATLDANCGGIIGCFKSSTNTTAGQIINCVNNGEIEGDEDKVAGIVGDAYNISVTGCKNTGYIHNTNLTGTDDEMGGIVGYGNIVHISKCINAGSIDAGDAYVGGIVGLLEGSSSVTNCVNGAFVNGDEEVGGIAGQIKDNSTVKYCIGASARIEGNTNVQKLVGAEPQNSTSNNYWIDNTSNIETGAVTEADLKSGKVAWHINNKLIAASAEAVWTQNLETDIYPVIGTAGVHYARTMTNEWGTVVLPYDVTYSQSNGKYKLYKLSAASASTLTFTEYENGTIPAGTPIAVQKLTGTGINIVPASTPNYSTAITEQTNSNASLPSGWTMKGTYTNLTDQKNIYFIAQNKFWWAESPITIAPYRAWFAGPAPTSSVKAFNIEIEDDDVTGIHEIVNGKLSNGKYLENGKVVIVRNGKKYNTLGAPLSR